MPGSADWSLPVSSTGYLAVLSGLTDRDVDAVTLIVGTPTNLPTGAIRYLRANDKFQEWNGAAWVDKVLAIAGGGTGGATAAAARTALGLGDMATQTSSAVAITGGAVAASLTGCTNIPAAGLTGTIAQARLGTGSDGSGNHFLADDQTYKASVVSGIITAYGGSSAPTGWFICDGQAVSRTTYAALFAIIGTTYGVGDGSTTFNVPDLRQRFPLGKAAAGTGNTLAGTGGAIDHAHTSAAHTHTYTDIVNHTHSITDPGHIHYVAEISGGAGPDTGLPNLTLITASAYNGRIMATGAPQSTPQITNITATNNPGGGVATGTTASTAPGNTGTNNPPYLVINYIIKQ